MSETAPVTAHPAATVVLLRDAAERCEVLLVQRNVRLSFHGGAWVFPGGRIDAQDYDATRDLMTAARRAAVREAREEAGITIDADRLVRLSRWVTPEGLPKRFDTWFFVAPAEHQAVQVDGGEIHAHQWLSPQQALTDHGAGRLDLPPPTFVTLMQLSRHRSVTETLSALACTTFEEFLPRLHVIDGGACTLYAGDVAYESGNLDEPGPRHRLLMVESGWRYERSETLPTPW
jgi:8-oxo-dGTP pyrophosphatase MutT (NUDIX family)